jgi:hypothetical protein
MATLAASYIIKLLIETLLAMNIAPSLFKPVLGWYHHFVIAA